MGAMASQMTSLTIVYSTVYSGVEHRKHQSSTSLATRWPVNSPHKCPVTRKMFPFDDVIMVKNQGRQWTHWGRVTHICVGTNTNIGSDNGLEPTGWQAIIWTNAGILLIGPLGTNFNGILSEIHIFSFKKIHLKMASGKWRPFCLGLNVLRHSSRTNEMSRWNQAILKCLTGRTIVP